MKVAAIQMPTVEDKTENIRTAGKYIEFPGLCRKRKRPILAGNV